MDTPTPAHRLKEHHQLHLTGWLHAYPQKDTDGNPVVKVERRRGAERLYPASHLPALQLIKQGTATVAEVRTELAKLGGDPDSRLAGLLADRSVAPGPADKDGGLMFPVGLPARVKTAVMVLVFAAAVFAAAPLWVWAHAENKAFTTGDADWAVNGELFQLWSERAFVVTLGYPLMMLTVWALVAAVRWEYGGRAAVRDGFWTMLRLGWLPLALALSFFLTPG